MKNPTMIEYGRSCSGIDKKNCSCFSYGVVHKVTFYNTPFLQHLQSSCSLLHYTPWTLATSDWVLESHLQWALTKMSLCIIKGKVSPSTCLWSYFKKVQSSCVLSMAFHYMCFLTNHQLCDVIVVLNAYFSLHCGLYLSLFEFAVVDLICLW